MSFKVTRKQYLKVWTGDRCVSRHVSDLEAIESASQDAAQHGEGDYEIRVGSEVFYEVTIRHLAQQQLGDLIIRRNDSPPINNPPIWDTQPVPIFNQGTASNFELDDLTSDPDMDTVTITLNTGTAPLPTGVTWNDTLDRLEYDGIGAIDTTTGHIATASDGTDVTDSDSFSIIITAAVTMDNWPFVTASMALGNITDRMDNAPAKTVIEASNVFIRQALHFDTTASRASTLTRLTTARTANADINIVVHEDNLMVAWDIQSSGKSERWFEQQTWDNPGDFDEYWLRESAPSGRFLCHVNGNSDGLAFNWGCNNTVMQRVIEGQLDQWTDFDGANDCMPVHWMQDTIPEKDSRYLKSGHGGTLSAVESSTEVDVPTWASVNTDGSPDMDGYEQLTASSNLLCWQANKQSGDYAKITGHKVINGSTDRFRLQNSLENMVVAVGSEFEVYPIGSKAYGTSDAGELSDIQWRQGIHNYGDRMVAEALTKGHAVDSFCNMGSRNASDKNDGFSPAWPTEDEAFWGGIHYEWIGTSVSFVSKPNQQKNPGDIAISGVDGYRINEPEEGRNYSPDAMIRGIEYNKLLLKSDASSATGYPAVWLNAQTLLYANNQDCYAFLTPYDAAHIRFWHVLSWCFDNVAPQTEAERHDVPVFVDEDIIAAGNPTSTRNFGPYDPLGNGGKGTLAYRTPDFGTDGHIFKFDNCWIIINLRDPGATDPWIPHWEPTGKPSGSGQTITSNDKWTVAGVPVGKKLQHFDRTTYVNNVSTKFMGKKMTDFDAAFIMKDDVWNDPTKGPQAGGGYDNGDNFDCGPFECAVLMLVDE